MIVGQISLNYPQDLTAWQKLYGGEMPSLGDKLCAEAIAGFWKFAEKYHNYIEGIIANQEFDHARTTADHLRAQLYHALNDYWAPLGEVAAQRQVAPYRDFLDEATDLAQEYLGKLDLGLPGVLIYFNKVTSIRYCPYTNIAFAGTPYTQLFFQDWMAIPHELGHYLYWNLGGNLSEVRQRHQKMRKSAMAILSQDPGLQRLKPAESEAARTMILPWLEETFCDVVGTRLGGAGFLESLKALIRSSAGNAGELTENDERHVPLCARPFVRNHAHKLNGGTAQVDWDGFFKEFFQIESVHSLELEASPPDIVRTVTKMLKKTLVQMLVAEEPPTETTIPFVRLGLPEIILALEALVGFCNAQINDLLEAGLPGSADPALAFDQLLTLAEEEAKARGKRPYEILLSPWVLEGGEQHGPHGGVTVHGKAHTIAVHNH